jgi:proteic killer suppression protein
VRLQSVSLCDTLGFVIISFRHKGLRLLYETGSGRGVQSAHVQKLLSILGFLDRVSDASELNLPTLRTHPLKGDRKGFWSIWVNGNWRITFRFIGNNVELVDYEDYH